LKGGRGRNSSMGSLSGVKEGVAPFKIIKGKMRRSQANLEITSIAV
jgi:hypothetical protein